LVLCACEAVYGLNQIITLLVRRLVVSKVTTWIRPYVSIISLELICHVCLECSSWLSLIKYRLLLESLCHRINLSRLHWIWHSKILLLLLRVNLLYWLKLLTHWINLLLVRKSIRIILELLW
jgi:hypothetical protein